MYGSHPYGTLHKRDIPRKPAANHPWRTRDNAADNAAAAALIGARR